jgi:phosphate-selective porin OprO/OprP
MRIFRPGVNALIMLFSAAFFQAHAAESAPAAVDDALIEALVEKGILSRAEADNIISQRAASTPPAQRRFGEVLYEPTEPVRDDDPSIQVRRFTVDSADGQHRFRFRGRFQFDVGRADFGSGIPAVARQSAEFPRYGTIVRRARLGALGYMYKNWEWQLEADFSDIEETELANAYIAYLTPRGRIVAGHFKEPFGLEYATSSRRITFLERSAASDAYKVNRELGLMYETIRPNWYGAFGIFGGDGYNINRDVEEGWALSGRLAFAPYHVGTDFVHIGAAVNHRWNGFDRSTGARVPLRLRTREGTRTIDARLIGRDDLVGVEKFTRSGLEFAAGFDTWSVQAEWIHVDIDLDSAAVQLIEGANATLRDDLTQKGWYVQGTWFLTGEQRVYRPASGNFGRVIPRQNFEWGQGMGALELAARYSVADSSQNTRIGRGQEMEHWTLGLNWYLNPDVIIKLNAIYLDAKGNGAEDDGFVYAARFQFEF